MATWRDIEQVECEFADGQVRFGSMPGARKGADLDITEVVITRLNAEATRLVVEWWTPEQGLRRVERE